MWLGCECHHARKREFGDFEKDVSWDFDSGPGSPEVSWDLTLSRAVQLGGWLKDDVGTVSIVKIVSLSLLVSKT